MWKASTRRNFLRGSLAVGATALLPASMNAANAGNFSELVDRDLKERHEPQPLDPAEFQPFMHGVASGDPLPQSVILWTRVTPDATAVPGSGRGEDVRLHWQVALDVDFAEVVRAGEVVASADSDHTVHVDPWNLQPNTEYFYRFTILSGKYVGTTSKVGRTKTAPAYSGRVDALRFAVCSCANFESGYFSAYSDIAKRAAKNEIDAVIHLGDYIYEYASGVYTGGYGVVRPHEPTWEIVSLADYRTRYGRYRRDAELQAAHGAAPWIVMWDDHEIANNAWSDGAAGHNPWKGAWADRKAAAQQAYLEWLPVRWDNRLYRSLKFGDLAELTMLDLRSYRSKQSTLTKAADPERTMLGSEQTDWLFKKLAHQETRWSVIGTSVMLTPVSMVGLDSTLSGAVSRLIGEDASGVPYNLDQWDGYAADRAKILNLLAEREQPSAVFLAGDIHSEWASLIHHEGAVVGAELVCTSVSAPNVDDFLGARAARMAADHLRGANPHISHVELAAHGFSVVEFSRASVSMQWMRVDDVTVAGSPIGPAASARLSTLTAGENVELSLTVSDYV
ncbi:alkaline phosphatase D family protein [Corynebacterium epidermidicanis]|nr:alkaline phosphatase D family protein [Corynebacterium epidermidicanis]